MCPYNENPLVSLGLVSGLTHQSLYFRFYFCAAAQTPSERGKKPAVLSHQRRSSHEEELKLNAPFDRVFA